MVKETLLVGQAPSRTTQLAKTRPLDGASGRRIEALVGLLPGQLDEVATCVNLLSRWPGPIGWAGGGDAFPLEEARRGVARVRRLLRQGVERLVLLGRFVARAFDVGDAAFGRWWTTARGLRVVVVPHPSGVNRWWNVPANATWGATVLRDALGVAS